MSRGLRIAASCILGASVVALLLLGAFHIAANALRTHAPRAAAAWRWQIYEYALSDTGWLLAGLLLSAAFALLGIFIAKWFARDIRRM